MKSICILILWLTAFSPHSPNENLVGNSKSIYFDLGNYLKLTFNGTYEFKYKELIYEKITNTEYHILSQGDQSPVTSKLIITDTSVTQILDWSKEEWYRFEFPISKGHKWKSKVRGAIHHYKIIDTSVTLETPIGILNDCVKIWISWKSYGHDEAGSNEIILFLAPHLGIVKKMVYADGQLWHEEVVASIQRQKK